jgi:pyruvate ferredoxin oxidoreductase gamma subunit/2-oxoisovalerate ferredoxin oxidoreductase gamma subunit
MPSLIEIRFHGRGGQGAVTAANLLVRAALKSGNADVQASPFFGAERRGAPVKAFARISGEHIYLRSQVYNPDLVLVLDRKLVDLVDVTEGLKENGTVIINTAESPSDVRKSLKKGRIAAVDATGIALRRDIKVGGIPVVNTAILGAVPRVIDRVKLDKIIEVIKERFGEEAGEKNAEAARDAYRQTEVG